MDGALGWRGTWSLAVNPRRNGTNLANVDAGISAEPMTFDCERFVDSGLRQLLSMEK
jgi:hypothetical protein